MVKGEAKAPELLSVNPAGQVPVLFFNDDGRPIAQSNAIMIYLAEGSDLIPSDRYERAVMFQWLFWEQYSHEPAIAVRRFQKLYLGKPDAGMDPTLMTRGNAALGIMHSILEAKGDWFAGGALSLADVALLAYKRVAHEGGFDLANYPAVEDWVARVEKALPITSGNGAAE